LPTLILCDYNYTYITKKINFLMASDETEKHGHESLQGLEPRMTALARASSNLPDLTDQPNDN
jgi:hypothetical protein